MSERPWLHLTLFVLTTLSVMATWVAWSAHIGPSWSDLDARFFAESGLFAGALLLFLTVHEFGHYFAGKYHQVSTSLPYYIPLPFLGIGTLGAVIRIREPIPTTRKLFDIGASGPIAGFVLAVVLLVIALAFVPGPEFVLTFAGHDGLKEYVEAYGRYPDALLPDESTPAGATPIVGQTLLYWGLSQLFPNVPPMYEMYHFPLLFAGWLGLFFTALNLLPVGQLDGGHILYSLVGPRWHAWIARGFVLLLLLSGSIGLMAIEPVALPDWFRVLGSGRWIVLAALLYLCLNRLFSGDHAVIAPALVGLVVATAIGVAGGELITSLGYWPWLLWSALIVFVIKVDHPPVLYPEPLTTGRRWLGVLSILIFILCFSFRPLYVV
jgi:membrane-associated protease RseP (regulator of RpoE activity)